MINWEEFKKESDRINRLYYRLILNSENIVSIVEMQWWDEYDYDQDRFITDETFDSKKEAIAWYNNKVAEAHKFYNIKSDF